MAPAGGEWPPLSRDYSRDSPKNHRNGHGYPRPEFAAPPFQCRPKLFCCPVAESNPAHLPRSFVNPGRHLMNLQLRSFLECADDAEHTLSKCEVSHIVEVTTRALHNEMSAPAYHGRTQEQWNVSTSMPCAYPLARNTPPREEDEDRKMTLDEMEMPRAEIPMSTYQSRSTRYFITQNSHNVWQIPPHSRQYRETHHDSHQGRTGSEKYMEIPPFKTTPYTSECTSGAAASGAATARPWTPSCSVLMWCTRHSNFYEVHVLS